MNNAAYSTPKILIYYYLADVYERLIRQSIPDAHIVATHDEAVYRQHIGDAEILMSFQVPLGPLPEARKLRWIQAVSAGVDFLIPVREKIRHVLVTNGRGVHAPIIADYTMATIGLLQWDFRTLLRNQEARKWDRHPRNTLGRQTLGIVGLGMIGETIARRAVAASMRVLGVRRGGEAVPGVDRVYPPERMGEMLGQSDFVIIAVPGTPETVGLIGAKELAAFKRGSHMINFSRGKVVDEAALMDALNSGQLAGAVLDVFAQEPLPPDNPLWGMPNVIITPHIAGLQQHTPEVVAELFLDNLGRFGRGETLRNIVDLDRGY